MCKHSCHENSCQTAYTRLSTHSFPKKILKENTGWWLLQGCLGQFLKTYLLTHVLHGSWRNCEPKGACLFSACIICTYSCCFSCVNVLANWHVPLSERDYTIPSPFNWCHQLHGVSNIWELSAIYIYLTGNGSYSPMMFMAWILYYSMVIHHSRVSSL